jgi:hypothetical protein
MNRRVFFSAIVFILLGLAVWRFWLGSEGREAPATLALAVHSPLAGPSRSTPAPVVEAPGAISTLPPAEERIALADPLNARERDIQSDLRVLNDIFEAWQTNFPHDGNPVGENSEITTALTGDNRLQLALIPRNHPAINARGELCDRWGTPFRFHQLSGTRMEIRSAGPDRKFGTPDDAAFSP